MVLEHVGGEGVALLVIREGFAYLGEGVEVGSGVIGGDELVEDAVGGEEAEKALEVEHSVRVRVSAGVGEDLRRGERGWGVEGEDVGDAEADDGSESHGDGEHIGELHYREASILV